MPVSGAEGFQSWRGLQGMDHNYAKPKNCRLGIQVDSDIKLEMDKSSKTNTGKD
jgi:hypothetical protein